METKFYIARAEYFNEITDEETTMECAVFAKSVTEVEEKIKEDFGEHFIGINSVEKVDHLTPIF